MEEQIENIYPASHAKVSKGTLPLSSVASGIMKLEPKPTAVKRTQEYNVKRVVLRDLNKNTQKMQGGCGNSNSVASTPVTCPNQLLPQTTGTSECELPVQFTREFVEELVENVPSISDDIWLDISDKTAPHHTKEETSHLKFETQESLPGSLPDLLLPEAAFKKHSDTDTDTTEYESAAETDPPDGLSHSSSIVADDTNVFEESSRGSAVTFETQKEETVETFNSNGLSCGDISILCADLNNLNLNSPVVQDITVRSVKELECDIDSDLNKFNLTSVVQGVTVHSVEKLECDVDSDLNKLNLSSPVVQDITVHSVEKLECDIDSEHSLAPEKPCSDVVEVSSSRGLCSINADQHIHLNTPLEIETVVPEVPEAAQKEQSLNEENNLCPTSADLSLFCNNSVVQPNHSVETNPENHSLETDVQIECINKISVGVEDTVALIPTSVGDSNQNLSGLPTIPDSDLSCGNTKIDSVGCEDTATLETPVDSTCLSPEGTSTSYVEECSKITDSVPQYVSVDTVVCTKEFPESVVSGEVDSVISEVIGEEHVISEKPSSGESNTTYELANCEETPQGLNITTETHVCVHGNQDIPPTVADLRSSLPNNSVELSEPALQGDGDSVEIDDKDYKLYENIIEISRLQEKDLEKEYSDGSTIKKENYNREDTDFDNICCNQEELKDFVNETSITDIPEFGNISSEAEKVAEEIFNVSQEIEEEVNSSIVVDLKCDMEDHTFLNMDDRIDPFAPKSALRHSPPPVPRTNSPNSSSSRGSSPAKRHSNEKSSPKTRSKSGTSTPGKESSLSDSDSPRIRTKASDSPSRLTKGNDAMTETTHAKHCVEESEGSGSGAPLGAETNNTTEDTTYSQKEVFSDPTTVNISPGSAEQILDPRRDSLYVKFDPLYTPSKCEVPLPQVERISLERQEDVAVKPDQEEEDEVCPGSNQALAYIDKLISLSPTVPKPEKSAERINDRTSSHISQSEISVLEKESVKKVNSSGDSITWNNNCALEVPQDPEMLNELQELRNMVLKQEQSYTEKVKILEKKIESLEIKLKEKDEKESKLNKKIAEMTEGQEQISIIMEEYERTIAGLVYEKEQEKQRFEQEKENLVKDKDTVTGHLENIEIAFSDVHRKYERSKDIIQGMKTNEEKLRVSLAEYEATFKQQEQKYDFLKSYATSQLDSANQELESLRRSHQAESAKLHAMLKKAEIKASSLEEMLEQKIKENQELTAICDELIGKVGSSE